MFRDHAAEAADPAPPAGPKAEADARGSRVELDEAAQRLDKARSALHRREIRRAVSELAA